MTTAARHLVHTDWNHARAWLPAIILPSAVFWACASWPAWALAWALAFAVYAGLKWLAFSLSPAAQHASVWRSLDYLLLWPGMDAQAFLKSSPAVAPRAWDWLGASAKFLAGLVLIFVVTPIAARRGPLFASVVGLVGIAVSLLFGFGHVLSLWWRRLGVNAQPITNRPIAATSLGDFWSNRWNLAFRDAVRAAVFQPLVARLGLAKATMAVFLFSGIVHDLVMSLPVRAGIGLPTIYFLIQGVAVLFERSRTGVRLGFGRGVMGRAFGALVVLGPLGLLFHAPFLEGVIFPTLRILSAV